jgi:D-alanyl-D-alanine carboxypeptidase (penicillin-binding protein 5/6)
MASTTKILTAIVIIENCNLEETITITKDTIGIEGSSIYLEEGEKLTIKDLLYGLMLRSGNDCAETLAKHCSGSIENFAVLMNETAKKIGANSSNFVNPHGLHNDKHYTTAYDLALISAYSIKNPVFKEIVSTKRVKIPQTTRNYDRILINKNKMLNMLDGATGIKTGFTKKAGRCLVTSCFRNGMELISVVLNCPPMFEKSKSLINNVYENYNLTKIIESDNIIDFIDINGKKTPIHIKNDIVLPLKQGEKDDLKILYDYPKTIKNETENDTEIGFVKIYLKNNLLFTEKIYTI